MQTPQRQDFVHCHIPRTQQGSWHIHERSINIYRMNVFENTQSLSCLSTSIAVQHHHCGLTDLLCSDQLLALQRKACTWSFEIRLLPNLQLTNWMHHVKTLTAGFPLRIPDH